jgi:hypothetical protein
VNSSRQNICRRTASSTCRLCVLACAFLTNNMRLSNGISETKPTLMRVYTMGNGLLQLLAVTAANLVACFSCVIDERYHNHYCNHHLCRSLCVCCLCLCIEHSQDLSYHNQHTIHSLLLHDTCTYTRLIIHNSQHCCLVHLFVAVLLLLPVLLLLLFSRARFCLAMLSDACILPGKPLVTSCLCCIDTVYV